MTKRLPLIDAIRAVTASLVAWHHFLLYLPALTGSTEALAERLDELFRDHRGLVQIFFVISGYVLARNMSPRRWNLRQVGLFAARRYCRLGFPYLAAMVLAIAATFVARHYLEPDAVDAPPTVSQVLAHVAFLQDILGYPSLSAGLWFVCIEFQLGLLFVAMLYVRDRLAGAKTDPQSTRSTAILLSIGLPLALGSLFYFNLDPRWNVWAVYFFGQFFFGVVVFYALHANAWHHLAWIYFAFLVVALVVSWRSRLAIAALAGALLYVTGRVGLIDRWPASRTIAFFGRSSYSLFLIHYPVLLLGASCWVYEGWNTPDLRAACLIVVYALSLATAEVFFWTVELPAVEFGRRFK